eukprot:SAG31_NODE_5480_length_2514_cov_1.932919_2_plen_513_part_00
MHWKNIGCAVANTSWYDATGLDTGSATLVDGKPALMYPGVHPNRSGELPNWNCVNKSRDCTANALIIASPANLSDVWLRHWTKQPIPAIQCHGGRCPMGESGYIDDPSTAWRDPTTKRYYATFGSGMAEVREGGGTQALLCSSPNFFSNWSCTDLLWKFGGNGSADAASDDFEPDGGAIFGHPGGNAIACPDFYRLERQQSHSEQLWVYEAGLEADKGSSPEAKAACGSLAGCYWLGRYIPPAATGSAFEHHFVPIHQQPKAMMGGDSVGKSFWHAESGRRLLWSSHSIGAACAGKCDAVLSVAKEVGFDSVVERLTLWPAKEIELLRVQPGKPHRLAPTTLLGRRAVAERAVPDAAGCRLDIEANFTLPASFIGRVGIRVLCDDLILASSHTKKTDVAACAAPDAFVNVSGANAEAMLANNKMVLDIMTRRNLAAPWPPLMLQLRLLVDGASLELFVNGGLASVAGATAMSPLALQRAATGAVRVFAAANGNSNEEVAVSADAYTLTSTMT